ncbi:hypothetical protein [Sphingomonas faeni]|uniref:hypothetical protein n=1 Tax=Sphingomonas faeni TaxID=185950 RepID=UPI0020BE228F|nr:hypothetical protein [Sphingomonas faeni]MCK8458553.1 hypothetical protein [Sphingomonas faeni]
MLDYTLEVHPTDKRANRDYEANDHPAFPGSRGPANPYNLWLKPFARMIHDGSETGENGRRCLPLRDPKQYMSRKEDASMPADIMKVDDQAKIDLFQEIMPIVIKYLAANSADQELIADDIIDFFALSIASVIQNDTNLTTPQQQRKGVETYLALGPALKAGSRTTRRVAAGNDDRCVRVGRNATIAVRLKRNAR